MKGFSEIWLPGLNVVLPLVFFLCATVSFYSGILYQEVTPLLWVMVFYISCVRSDKFAPKIFKSVKSSKICTGKVFLPPFGVGNLVLLQAMCTNQ